VSKFPKSALWLSLIFILVASIGLAGCSSNETTTPAITTTTPPITETTAPATTTTPAPTSTPTPTPTLAPTPATQEIIKNSAEAMSKITTYQYDLSLIMNMDGQSAGEPQTYGITATGSGVNNTVNQQMKVDMEMAIEAPGQGKIILPVTVYQVNGWQYMKVAVPFAGETWAKNKVDTTSFGNKDDAQQTLEILQNALTTKVTGIESVDGTPCYVLEVTPDAKTLSELLKSFQGTSDMGGFQTGDLDLSKFLKNMSIKVWITKDTYLLKEADVSVNISITGTDLGSDAEAGDNLNMDIRESTKMTQFNQPVSITLPPESQNAQEVTG
jgi:hypothetical protein